MVLLYKVYLNINIILIIITISSSATMTQADDLDGPRNNVIQYELEPPSNVFELLVRIRSDGSSHIRLVLKGRLDCELTSGYQFQVVAYDGGSPRLSGRININMTVWRT